MGVVSELSVCGNLPRGVLNRTPPLLGRGNDCCTIDDVLTLMSGGCSAPVDRALAALVDRDVCCESNGGA